MTSRIASSLTRDPVVIEPRAMTPARRKRIIERDKRCKYPGCEETEGLEIDHIVPLALGGRDADDNLECRCGPHHKIKTAADIKAIAKAKRLHATHNGQKPPPTRKMNGRGFQRRWRDL